MRRTPIALLLALLLSACAAQAQPEKEKHRFPTSRDFSTDVMVRIGVTSAGATPWRLSALETPRQAPTPWKIVVITGTPSWSEFWAPTLAKTPADREMIVADRPGFAQSQPKGAVPDIAAQADALAALLAGPADQKVVVVGQSYGGPIAAMLAARHPDKVKGLVLMSAFFGERGPAIRRLDALGSMLRPALPRDMQNALAEVKDQASQLPQVRAALAGVTAPIVVLHGDRDDFVPMAAARRLADETHGEFMIAAGGDHFLNACCVDNIWAAIDRTIALNQAQPTGAQP